MALPMFEALGLRSESHQRDHLRGFIASKQGYLDVKAAKQRAEHAANMCKAVPPQKPMIPVGEEVLRNTQQVDKIHNSVLEAIHAALTKESLVKKLVLPFNETLAAATKGAASSRWECRRTRLAGA